jgi:hypothetical protein
MANVQAFNPVLGATKTITGGVGNVTGGSAIFSGNGYRQVRVFNEGTATAWVNFGGASVTASNTTDMPVAAGATEVLTVPPTSGGTYAAIYTAAATGNVYFTPGSGL